MGDCSFGAETKPEESSFEGSLQGPSSDVPEGDRQYSSQYTKLLHEDCDESKCPAWKGDSGVKETMAVLPPWMVSYVLDANHGYTWPTEGQSSKSYGSYDWTFAAKTFDPSREAVHKLLPPGPYSSGAKPRRILKLSTLFDVDQVVNHNEWISIIVGMVQPASQHNRVFMAANMQYRINRDRVITMDLGLHDLARNLHTNWPEFTLTYPEYDSMAMMSGRIAVLPELPANHSLINASNNEAKEFAILALSVASLFMYCHSIQSEKGSQLYPLHLHLASTKVVSQKAARASTPSKVLGGKGSQQRHQGLQKGDSQSAAVDTRHFPTLAESMKGQQQRRASAAAAAAISSGSAQQTPASVLEEREKSTSEGLARLARVRAGGRSAWGGSGDAGAPPKRNQRNLILQSLKQYWLQQYKQSGDLCQAGAEGVLDGGLRPAMPRTVLSPVEWSSW
eukprot:gene24897-10562_t